MLQVIMFVAALMLEPKCAPLITSSRIVRTFHTIFQDKKNDPEMTLQFLFCFYRMLRHPETLDDILYGCNMLPDLLLVADSPNVEVPLTTLSRSSSRGVSCRNNPLMMMMMMLQHLDISKSFLSRRRRFVECAMQSLT